MSDCCYLQMRVRTEDRPVIERVLSKKLDVYFLVENDGSGILELTAEEANYAYCDELARIAATGVPFEGFHDNGSSYHARGFAAIEGRLFEGKMYLRGWVCMVDENGDPVPESLAQIRAYLAARNRVLTLWKETRTLTTRGLSKGGNNENR